VGGIPEVVRHGAEGLLAPVGAVDELARLVLQLLENPALRAYMGRGGAQRVEDHFHFRDRISVVEQLYLEVLAKVHNGPRA
jgi:glycosyltransferase involved in cell wall biosynthesis